MVWSRTGSESALADVHPQSRGEALLACDFFVVVTARFRILYVFVLLEVGTRRVRHYNVTAHPTAEWTLQQFREALPDEHSYRFVIHDRDSIFSKELDEAVSEMGVRVLRTPVRAPKANAVCERLVGSTRRGVPGLSDSVRRAASEADPQMLVRLLQSRQSAHESWPRNSRSTSAFATNECSPSPASSRPRCAQPGDP
jgi:transposase InsO family protein